MLCPYFLDSLFSNDEDDDDDDLSLNADDCRLGHHHHHSSLSPGSTSLPGMVTPTKGGTLVGDTDVRTPITSSGDNSNPEKDNGNESEVHNALEMLPQNPYMCIFIWVGQHLWARMSIWGMKHMELGSFKR